MVLYNYVMRSAEEKEEKHFFQRSVTNLLVSAIYQLTELPSGSGNNITPQKEQKPPNLFTPGESLAITDPLIQLAKDVSDIETPEEIEQLLLQWKDRISQFDQQLQTKNNTLLLQRMAKIGIALSLANALLARYSKPLHNPLDELPPVIPEQDEIICCSPYFPPSFMQMEAPTFKDAILPALDNLVCTPIFSDTSFYQILQEAKDYTSTLETQKILPQEVRTTSPLPSSSKENVASQEKKQGTSFMDGSTSPHRKKNDLKTTLQSIKNTIKHYKTDNKDTANKSYLTAQNPSQAPEDKKRFAPKKREEKKLKPRLNYRIVRKIVKEAEDEQNSPQKRRKTSWRQHVHHSTATTSNSISHPPHAT